MRDDIVGGMIDQWDGKASGTEWSDANEGWESEWEISVGEKVWFYSLVEDVTRFLHSTCKVEYDGILNVEWDRPDGLFDGLLIDWLVKELRWKLCTNESDREIRPWHLGLRATAAKSNTQAPSPATYSNFEEYSRRVSQLYSSKRVSWPRDWP